MKEKINQINKSIEEKRNRLKEKAERYFTSVIIPSNSNMKQRRESNKKDKIPPVSYILYGVAALAAVGACASQIATVATFASQISSASGHRFGDLSSVGTFASYSRFICLGVAAVSAYGGYKLSKRTITSKDSSSTYSQTVNIGTIKSEVTSKFLDSVKKITNEWEEFMELKQREVQLAISTSSLNASEKDSMSSKVFIYEVIDISISEFSSIVNLCTSTAEIKNSLSSYKEKVISAIDNAADKQISKYNSLVV